MRPESKCECLCVGDQGTALLYLRKLNAKQLLTKVLVKNDNLDGLLNRVTRD